MGEVIGMEKIRASEPMKNMNHNLIHALALKLDSQARIDLYLADAEKEGCQSCMDLWQNMRNIESDAVDMLKNEILNHCENGVFE